MKQDNVTIAEFEEDGISSIDLVCEEGTCLGRGRTSKASWGVAKQTLEKLLEIARENLASIEEPENIKR